MYSKHCHQRAAITTVQKTRAIYVYHSRCNTGSRYQYRYLSDDGAELVVPGVPGLELGRRVYGVRHQLILALGYRFHLGSGPILYISHDDRN
jgi:hypothetical protein